MYAEAKTSACGENVRAVLDREEHHRHTTGEGEPCPPVRSTNLALGLNER